MRLLPLFLLFGVGFVLSSPSLFDVSRTPSSFDLISGSLASPWKLSFQNDTHLTATAFDLLRSSLESLPQSLGRKSGIAARSIPDAARTFADSVKKVEPLSFLRFNLGEEPPPFASQSPTLNIPADESKSAIAPSSPQSSKPFTETPVPSSPTIVERIILAGLSRADLDIEIKKVNAAILSESNLLRTLIDERSRSNFQAIALTNRINTLSGVSLSSVSVSSISGLTDADIPNDISIATSANLSGTSGSFSSTLGVTGLSTFTGGFISTASSSVSAGLQVAGALNASSSFQVAGASVFGGALTVNSGNVATLIGGFLSGASSTINANLTVLGVLNASSTLLVGGTGTSSIAYGLTIATSGGLVGIGTSTPAVKLHVFNTVSAPQFRIGYDKDFFADFQVDAGGDLLLAPSGTTSPSLVNSIRITNDNLFICSGGACPSPDIGNGMLTSAGNLIVENQVGIGTSTPAWRFQIASDSVLKNRSDKAFLVLSDMSAGVDLKHWFLSSQGGNLYVGTTTDGYATSTISALSLFSDSGVLSIGTSTDKLAGRPTVSATGTVIASSQIAPMGFPTTFSQIFATTTTVLTAVPAGCGATTEGGSWTVPEGVYRIWVEVSGGGGGGGFAAAGAGGGGGGGTASGFINVIPNQSITVTLGRGGAPGTSGTTNGCAGGTTTFGALSATGGRAGASGGEYSNGGVGSGGTLNLLGGGGMQRTANTFNGNGGNSFRGGGGGPNVAAGNNGGAYGGGGAGASGTSGGNGGGGGVIIWY